MYRALDLFCGAETETPRSSLVCLYCGTAMVGRADKRFCSKLCAARKRLGLERERACRHCGTKFLIVHRGDANRWHCSKQCVKNHHSKSISTWHAEHPGVIQKYNRQRLLKNPGTWREKYRSGRSTIIAALGGTCIVCHVTNTNWLQVDYKPTGKDLAFRHPRHPRFVLAHLEDFRLLCANHHYELTLTGRIEGTDITQ